MILDEADHRSISIDLRLPNGAKLVKGPVKGKKTFTHHVVEATDAFEGGVLKLRRLWDVEAARIESKDYAAFRAFCLQADTLADAETELGLGVVVTP
jgi:hypothetical protein